MARVGARGGTSGTPATARLALSLSARAVPTVSTLLRAAGWVLPSVVEGAGAFAGKDAGAGAVGGTGAGAGAVQVEGESTGARADAGFTASVAAVAESPASIPPPPQAASNANRALEIMARAKRRAQWRRAECGMATDVSAGVAAVYGKCQRLLKVR